jgi:hypothetical protein
VQVIQFLNRYAHFEISVVGRSFGEGANRGARADRDQDQTGLRERLADDIFAAGLRRPAPLAAVFRSTMS